MVLSPASTSTSSNPTCSLPYGTAPNVHDNQTCEARREKSLPPLVGLLDRKAHTEAFLVSFLAEHSLPFTITPHLIRFAQELSKDHRTLQSLSMSRVTASYKLNEGLASFLTDSISDDLKQSYFSLNLDECFSNAHEKVFSIIVSYYSERMKRVVVQHYNTHKFTVVNAVNLFNHVKSILLNDEIPLNNVISNLSDSTNYMRGKISGFETLLRQAIPHLLDIDGDICHHTHNSVKKFLSPFEKYIESLVTDVRTDAQWSTDLRDYLSEICQFLNIRYQMPADRVDHRWLSSYDAAVVDNPLLPALTVMYYSWIPKENRSLYKELVHNLLKVTPAFLGNLFFEKLAFQRTQGDGASFQLLVFARTEFFKVQLQHEVGNGV